MAFEEVKENTENIKNQLQLYFDKYLAYVKLRLFKVFVQCSISIIKYALIMVLTFLLILFASIALAFVMSDYFNSYVAGFLSVSGIYFVLIVLFLFFSKNFLEKQLLMKLSKFFINNKI